MKNIFWITLSLFFSSLAIAQDFSGRDKQAGKDGKKAFSKGDYNLAAQAYSITSDKYRKDNPKAQYEYLYACFTTNRIMRAALEVKSEIPMKGPKKMLSPEELTAQITDLSGQYEYAIQEGKIHLKSKNAKEALSSADFAIEIDPFHLDGHLLRGRAFLLMENWLDATASIQDIIDAKIPDESAYYIRARAKLGNGDQSGALEDLNTSIKIRPSAEANYLRGSLYVKMDQGRRALNDLFTAIRLQADFIEANYLLGKVELEEGDFEKALDYLTATLKIEDGYQDAYFLRGKAHYELGNYYSSQQDFLAQLVQHPKDAHTHFELGKVYMNPVFDTLVNQMQKALFHIDQALQSNPNNDSYLVERAILKSKMGNTSSAIQDFEKAIAINPTEFEFYYSRLKVQREGKISTSIRMKGLKNAEEVFKQETQKPRKGPGFMNLSKVYLLMYEEGFPGDWLDSSLMAIDVSLKESQRNADYFFQKGTLYKRGFKDFKEAEVFFKKATDIDPNMGAAWLELAKVIYNQNDIRRAIETLKQGLKRVENSQKIKSLLDEWCDFHPGDC